MAKFWNFINLSDEESELRIEGEIIDDGWAWIYEWFDEPYASPNSFRKALNEHKGKNITVWVDSWGGDVFAAAGIYNALKEHKGKVVVKIDGKAVSAGSVIAMAGDEVLMSPASILMIHNPWSRQAGESKDMRHAANVLDEVKETILNVYQSKTGRTRDELSKMMDEESWMSAQKAINEGFVDGMLYVATDEPVQVLNSFSLSRSAIMNSSDNVMTRFFEQWQKVQAGKGAPTPAEPEVTPSNRLNDIKMRVSVRERQNRRYSQ
jgi:ATP-dependent Clp protease protease subunit